MVLSPSLLSRTRKLEYLLKVHLISCSNLSSFMRPLISDQKPTQIGFSITHVIFSHFSQGSFSDDSTAPQISRRKRKCQARLKSMIYFTSCRLSRTLRTETGRDRHGQLRGHQRFYYWDEEIYYWESKGNKTNLLTRVDENYWHDFCKKYQQKCFWAESEVDEAEKSWA